LIAICELSKFEVRAEIEDAVKTISQIQGVEEIGIYGSCLDWLNDTSWLNKPEDIDLLVVTNDENFFHGDVQPFIDACEQEGHPLQLDIKLTGLSPYWPDAVDTIYFDPDRGYVFDQNETRCGKDFFDGIRSLWRKALIK
jgi:hypothetical protein